MKFIPLILLALLAGCQKDPESSRGVGAFRIERLFEVDGCTVYRFYDDRTVYFTKCDGAKSNTAYSESCGKNCTRLQTN